MKLIDRRKFLNITRIYKDDPSDVVFRKYAVRRLIKAQPVVNAIPLDKVKQAREEIIATNDSTLAIVEILDKLIAESEG